MKIKSEQGFSAFETTLILVIIVALVGVGYWVYKQNHNKTSTSSTAPTSAQAVKADGTTRSVDNLAQQDSLKESSINSKYETSEQASAKATNQATSNVGGAYDESTY